MGCHMAACRRCTALSRPHTAAKAPASLTPVHTTLWSTQILLKYNEGSKQFLPVSSDVAPSSEEHMPAHYDRNGWHFAENATICIYR